MAPSTALNRYMSGTPRICSSGSNLSGGGGYVLYYVPTEIPTSSFGSEGTEARGSHSICANSVSARMYVTFHPITTLILRSYIHSVWPKYIHCPTDKYHWPPLGKIQLRRNPWSQMTYSISFTLASRKLRQPLGVRASDAPPGFTVVPKLNVQKPTPERTTSSTSNDDCAWPFDLSNDT